VEWFQGWWPRGRAFVGLPARLVLVGSVML